MNDGQQLRKLLLERAITQEQFRKKWTEKTGQAPNTVAKFLKEDTPSFSPGDLCLICSVFGFRSADFGRPADFFRSDYSSQIVDAEVYCYNDMQEGDLNYRPYPENFFKAVERNLLMVRRSLWVSDYFAKIKGLALKTEMDFYHKRNSAYYLELEKRMEKHRFEYKRIFQLPLGTQISSPEQAIETVILGMFQEDFEHFLRCLKNFGDCCEFHVVANPFRLHTFFIVDGEIALTEYNRFDKNGVAVPDTLFINRTDPGNPRAVGSIYLRSCIFEFQRILNMESDRKYLLDLPVLVQTTLLFHDKLVDLRTKLLAEIKDLEARTNLPSLKNANERGRFADHSDGKTALQMLELLREKKRKLTETALHLANIKVKCDCLIEAGISPKRG